MTTTSTAPRAQRRGSFLETWRLFADGGRPAAIVGLLILGSVVLMTAMMPAGKDPVAFSVYMVVCALPWGTWAIERQGSNRLAFMSLVPQPVPPKGVQEFLAAKPLGDRPRFVGGIVFPLLVLLLAPVTAACLVNRQVFDHGGVLGWILGSEAPRGEMLEYMHNVLGATFLPEKWPAGGLPVELWVRLRPLLYRDVLRSALLLLALALAAAPYVSSGRKERPPLCIAVALVTFAAYMRLATSWKSSSVPVPHSGSRRCWR